jgi:E-phenylitaconyl-CoA hydratase
MNAFNAEIRDSLPVIWEEIRRDDDVRVIIITGAGDRAFSVGMDVKAAAAEGGPAARERTGRVEEDLKLTPLHCGVWKPVIAAVNGVCAGGGLHFVADADIVVCADHASFVDSHVSVGQVAAIEPIMLSRRIPLSVVMELALVGRSYRLEPARALEIGLVNYVVPYADLMPTAEAIARKICLNSPAAMMRTKKAVWQGLEMSLHDAMQQGWDLLREHWDHPDYREGPRAFAEHRAPNWSATEP